MLDTKIFFEDKIIYFLSDLVYFSEIVHFKQIELFENKDLEFYFSTEVPKADKLVFFCKEKATLERILSDFFVVLEAAGGLVKNNKNEYLIIERFGKWDLPKGKLEENETPEEAALREVEEETAVGGLKIVRKIADTYHIYFRNYKAHLKKTYWFAMTTDSDIMPQPQTEEAIIKAIWLPEDRMNEVCENTFLSIKEVVKNCYKL